MLEGLEELILPSVAPVGAPPSLPAVSVNSPSVQPAVAEVTSQVASTMQQWAHLLATVEQNASSTWRTIDQALVAEVAHAQTQWEHLLGIIANAPNLSPDSGVPADSGTATMAQTQSSTQGGNGSPSIQPLTSTLGNAYLWDPVNPDLDINASNSQNWLLNGVRGVGVPGAQATDMAIFNPNDPSITDGHGNADIIWDYGQPFSSMQITGYTGNQTVDYGIELTGVDSGNPALAVDNAGQLNMNLRAAQGKLQVDGDSTITTCNITGVQGSQLIINSGQTNMAGSPGYSENIGVQFTINQGASVLDYSFNPITFTASNLLLTVKGTLTLYYGGTGQGMTLIQPKDQTVLGCYIDVAGGTLTYDGTASAKDTVAMPVLVENNGNFNVTNLLPQSSGGWLIVTGQVQQTQKYSVYMTSGNVKLSNGTTLECDDDYQQTGGGLQTTGTSECALQDGPNSNGTAVIAGGSVVIAQGGAFDKGYGKLDVNCANLSFNGKLVLAIQGDQSGTNSVLQNKTANGTITLGPQSSLVVTVNNSDKAVKGDWVIMDKASNIIGDFPAMFKTTNPFNAKFTFAPNTPEKGQYDVSYPG